MKNVFLGEYIKQRRLDLGLTQEQLCDGICEPMTLSRLENGKQTPSRNRINALLQRLGLPDDRYFALLSKNELEMEALQKEIVACNATEKVPEGFEKLAQFEKLADPDDQIAQQFALRSRVLLGRLDGRYTPLEQIDLLMQAIQLTVPRFDLESIESFLCGDRSRKAHKWLYFPLQAYPCGFLFPAPVRHPTQLSTTYRQFGVKVV